MSSYNALLAELALLESGFSKRGGEAVSEVPKPPSDTFDTPPPEHSSANAPASDTFDTPPPGHSEKHAPDALQAERERAGRAREERRKWGDDLCRRVSAGVAHQSPKGLGSWPQAWRIVAAADARLLALLAIFEETGEEGDRRAAVHAAEDLAIAWEKAAKAWEARKR